MRDIPVVCSAVEFATFPPPSGQTCQEYLSPFLSYLGQGYIDNPSATDECRFCTYSNGNQVSSSPSSPSLFCCPCADALCPISFLLRLAVPQHGQPYPRLRWRSRHRNHCAREFDRSFVDALPLVLSLGLTSFPSVSLTPVRDLLPGRCVPVHVHQV